MPETIDNRCCTPDACDLPPECYGSIWNYSKVMEDRKKMEKKLKIKVDGKLKTIEREIKGDVYVEFGDMYRLWGSSCGVFLQSQHREPNPFAHFYGYATKGDIVSLLNSAIREIKKFDKEKAIAELRQAIEQADEIAGAMKC